MKLNWNFLGGPGVQNKKPSLGGVWIFLELHIILFVCVTLYAFVDFFFISCVARNYVILTNILLNVIFIVIGSHQR